MNYPNKVLVKSTLEKYKADCITAYGYVFDVTDEPAVIEAIKDMNKKIRTD